MNQQKQNSLELILITTQQFIIEFSTLEEEIIQNTEVLDLELKAEKQFKEVLEAVSERIRRLGKLRKVQINVDDVLNPKKLREIVRIFKEKEEMGKIQIVVKCVDVDSDVDETAHEDDSQNKEKEYEFSLQKSKKYITGFHIKKQILQNLFKITRQISQHYQFLKQQKQEILQSLPKISKFFYKQLKNLSSFLAPQYFTFMTNTAFKNLQVLHISHVQMDTIQSISRMEAPKLRQINLDNNFISDVFALRKIQSNVLSTLMIGYNQVRQAWSLYQGNWPSFLDYSIQDIYTVSPMIENISLLAKMRFHHKNLCAIFIQNSDRILEGRVMKCLIRKIPCIEIWTRHECFRTEDEVDEYLQNKGD